MATERGPYSVALIRFMNSQRPMLAVVHTSSANGTPSSGMEDSPAARGYGFQTPGTRLDSKLSAGRATVMFWIPMFHGRPTYKLHILKRYCQHLLIHGSSDTTEYVLLVDEDPPECRPSDVYIILSEQTTDSVLSDIHVKTKIYAKPNRHPCTACISQSA